MGTGPSVGCYYFDGWDLPTKYGWMHSGAGVEAATRTQDAVRELAERLIASGERVRGLLGGAEWAGAAAIAAGEAMRRGAEQINQSAEGAATADHCVSELGECFVAAQRRVPSPNEVPSGLGDAFLYSAAEGFNTVSPFDVQSPLHAAMQHRRELEQQANLALTEHMTSSRERVEAMPAVTAPAPMTVTTQSAPPPTGVRTTPSGTARGSGYLATAGAPPRPAGAPGSTHAAGWSAAMPAPAPVAVVGVGAASAAGSTPASSGVVPARTDLAAMPASGPVANRSGTASTIGPRSGTGGAEADRSSGRGSASAIGGGLGHGRSSGRTAWPSGTTPGRAADLETSAGGKGTRPGMYSFLQPPVSGRGRDEAAEHRDRYAQHTDHIVGELPLVAPAVLGETPDEEAKRLQGER